MSSFSTRPESSNFREFLERPYHMRAYISTCLLNAILPWYALMVLQTIQLQLSTPENKII